MEEVARDNSLPFGFDEEFVNPVDEDFFCPICQLPAKEPIQTSCGHRFCEECIKEYLHRNERHGQYCTCPVDRETVLHKENIFPDIATKRKILSLCIKCPNDGCPWTDELREKENHLKSCEFQVVRCIHEHCQAMVISKDLESHYTRDCPWRIINCCYCQDPYAFCQEKDHYNHCRRFPNICDCGAVVSREMVQDHTENYCPKALIPCPYDKIGCKTKVPREKRELHLQSATGQHIKLVKEALTNTTKDLNSLQEQVNGLKENTEKRCEALENKVNTVERQLEKEIQIFKDQKNDLRKEFEEIVFSVKGQLEKEGHILKVELQKLGAAFDEKLNALGREFEERVDELSKHFEERINIIQKEYKEGCGALEKEMNALRRQHDEEVRVLKENRDKEVDTLQKDLAAQKKEFDTLKNIVETNQNQRAANEEEANNRIRELEEGQDWINTKVNIMGLGAVFIFVIVRILI